MPPPRLMDPKEANYSLDCMTCTDSEGSPVSLSHDGNNLTRSQALFQIRKHLRQNPSHEISWSALGSVPKLGA